MTHVIYLVNLENLLHPVKLAPRSQRVLDFAPW